MASDSTGPEGFRWSNAREKKPGRRFLPAYAPRPDARPFYRPWAAAGGAKSPAEKRNPSPPPPAGDTPPAYRRPQHPKMSYGVIVVQRNPATRRFEAAVVRGRYTYAFSDFVHAKYPRDDRDRMVRLFNEMSVNERFTILTLDFARMWFLVWTFCEKPELYQKKGKKFYENWIRPDQGAQLRKLIADSGSSENSAPRYEFPKGRRLSPHESELTCAIRETREETGFEKRDYAFIPGFQRKMSFVSKGVHYTNVYYAALARRPLKASVQFRNAEQVDEIGEVRWMDIEQIRLVDTPDRRLERTVRPVFRAAKKAHRGALAPSALVI